VITDVKSGIPVLNVIDDLAIVFLPLTSRPSHLNHRHTPHLDRLILESSANPCGHGGL